MNIKRYDIFPINHQSGNEIESAEGRYVWFADIEHLQQRLTAAEQRNAELVDLLTHAHIAIHTMEPGFFLLEKIDAALKPTESGASHTASRIDQ